MCDLTVPSWTPQATPRLCSPKKQGPWVFHQRQPGRGYGVGAGAWEKAALPVVPAGNWPSGTRSGRGASWVRKWRTMPLFQGALCTAAGPRDPRTIWKTGCSQRMFPNLDRR